MLINGISKIVVLILFLYTTQVFGIPEHLKIDSVKSLTTILTTIEKEHGRKVQFATLKLQKYLEDVYISQGASLYLKPLELSEFIGELVKIDRSRMELAKLIVARFKEGGFHE